MEKKLFITHAIDTLEDKGQGMRNSIKRLMTRTGWIPCGAGFGENPIIDINSGRLAKQLIIANNLKEQKNAHATLAITDLKTFAVGTWIELWVAHELGHHIMLYIINSNEQPKNIYLTGLVDKILYTEEELINYLSKI